MNITFFSSVSTREKVFNCIPEIKKHNVKFFKLNESDRLLSDGFDTDLLFIDAMGTLDKMLIDSMPNLKLIMSEGVGYQGIDEIYNGRQIEFKKASFGVKKELSECTVGLIGFGDIARKTAEFCNALGAKVIYTNRTRYKNLEEKLNVQYVNLDKLLSESDIVSLHIALTPNTINTVDDNFLSKMKNDAFLINTSRGDLVDNNALKNALLKGEIAGAGLDVFTPEPLEKDNPLLDIKLKDKLILTPHIAGITHLTVERIYKNILENTQNIIHGRELKNKVN